MLKPFYHWLTFLSFDTREVKILTKGVCNFDPKSHRKDFLHSQILA